MAFINSNRYIYSKELTTKFLMKHSINSKSFLVLMIAFFFFSLTAIFVQLFSFYPVAKYFQYETSIYYDKTSLCKSYSTDTLIKRLYEQYAYEIENDLEFPQKNQFKKYEQQQLKERLLIESTAPLICIILSITGFIYLLRKHKKNIAPQHFSLNNGLPFFLVCFGLDGCCFL